MQVVIDDSNNQPGHGHFFGLAGFMSPLDKWESFTLDWSKLLNDEPSIAYYKGSEARRLRGQFNGWTPAQRDRRESAFVDVIARFCEFKLHSYVNHSAFDYFIKQRPLPIRNEATDSPYLYLVVAMIEMVGGIMKKSFADQTCEVVFDLQDGFDQLVKEMWHTIMGYFDSVDSRGYSKYFCGLPKFRNSKNFLPLQAADMLAHYTTKHSDGVEPCEYVIEKIFHIPGYSFGINAEHLKSIGTKLRLKDDLERVMRPHAELFFPGPDAPKLTAAEYVKRLKAKRNKNNRP